MIKCPIIVTNPTGIHARPAAQLVQLTARFSSSIELEYEDIKINAKSIMGILTLGAGGGAEITLIADGKDEKEAVAAITAMFENNFEE